MSLEKTDINFYAICDFCPESFDTDETEFRAAVEAMQRQGWRVYKEGGEWHHKCTACLDNNDFDVVF